jgi:hypothetical protein
VGLVIDLRTTETQAHFTRSLDGLYTDSAVALEGFEEKFRLTWRQTEKTEVRTFLLNLIREITQEAERRKETDRPDGARRPVT